MVELDFYPHTCVIKRSTGVPNPTTGAEVFTSVHSGECCLQVSNSGDTKLTGLQYKSSPVLMLPITNGVFQINDRVEVTLANTRVIKGTVENFEVFLDEDLEGTALWLKDMVG